jgi:hypothetical protein
VTRRTDDGRQPAENCTEFSTWASTRYQQRMQAQADPLPGPRQLWSLCRPTSSPSRRLGPKRSQKYCPDAPEHAHAVLADPHRGAPWRAALGIEERSQRLSSAIDSMQKPVRRAIARTDQLTLNAVLAVANATGPGERELDALAHRILQSALEQRQMRLKRTGRCDDRSAGPGG